MAEQHYLKTILSHVAKHVANIDGVEEEDLTQQQYSLISTIASTALLVSLNDGTAEQDNAVELILEKLTRDAVEEKLIAHRSDNVSVLPPKVRKKDL
ncbi:MAG: hypothetical protein CMH32_02645 [Micavibrio sp.]|nr:hypothetical protein [Micavibrio sp.]HCK32709.1 hypothetical protein [Rhodospirillaceae bacterium]|tara:strand:- start:2326 stop:2616 length:291 start_codon:yes stop_codon:yes gene_type:complete